jgi:biopolymer transport protein ExbD
VNLNINKDGQVSVDDNPVAFPELFSMLTNRYSLNTNLPVYITGAADATHGSVMYVLDFVKSAGIRNVAIAVNATPDHSTP